MSEFWFPSQKGILHQPQGDDGSPGWLLRVQLFSEAGRSLPSATVARQSLTSGDREPRGLIYQEVAQDLLRQWPAIIVLFATSLSARLPVFFATAWHSSSLGATPGHMPSHPLPS